MSEFKEGAGEDLGEGWDRGPGQFGREEGQVWEGTGQVADLGWVGQVWEGAGPDLGGAGSGLEGAG